MYTRRVAGILLLSLGLAAVLLVLAGRTPALVRTASLPRATPASLQGTPKPLPPSPDISAGQERALVVTVIDGDTVKLADGRILRYIGVDAPEIYRGQNHADCFAQEATNRNRTLVEGKHVVLERDVSETDRYGRLLRYVVVGGHNVSELLIHQGYGRVLTIPPDVKVVGRLQAAEREAREAGRGLWGTACAAASRVTDDRDCKDFTTQEEAQRFFLEAGGPITDLHRLDTDGDGVVCESLRP